MGWIIFVVTLNGFLLIMILWCLIYMFSWLIVIFVLCIMYVLYYAFHARCRMSQWQLLVTLWCSLITLHLVVPAHSSYLHTTCTSVAHVNLLLTWFMYCGWVIFLSKYHCAFISLTNLDLIKLMFVSCGSALVLCCVYVLLQMSRCSSRGKEPVTDVPSSPISKRTRRSSQDLNSERFRTPFDSQTHSSIF